MASVAVMRTRLLLTLIGALWACTTPAQRSHGDLVRSQSIQVRPFTTDEAFSSRTDIPLAAIGRRMAEDIAKELRGEGVRAEVLKSGALATAPMVIEGEFTTIDGGNQAVRWLAAGPITGAGKAKLAAQGRVVNSEGATIGEFHVSDTARGGFFGGDATGVVEDCIETLGTEVALRVIQGDFNGPESAE
jgi:hypothetical protein